MADSLIVLISRDSIVSAGRLHIYVCLAVFVEKRNFCLTAESAATVADHNLVVHLSDVHIWHT